MKNIFENKKYNEKKLLNFGFKEVQNKYIYKCFISDDEFEMTVIVDKKGNIDTKITEKETNEPYTLHLIEGAKGEFVGKIRDDYLNILNKISDYCFETDVFKSPVTIDLIKYIKDKYDDEPEFLWDKFKGNAIVRRKDNLKWYCVFLTVSQDKLGFENTEKVEIIDLRVNNTENIVDNKVIFKGYHMNKKHWITIILDGKLPRKFIQKKIDESYILAKNKK